VKEIERLLSEVLGPNGDDAAKRNFMAIRKQLQDVQTLLIRCDHMADAMLKDKKVDFRKIDNAEFYAGYPIYQFLQGACSDLSLAHTAMLEHYEDQRGSDAR